jgi:ribose transport system ATP-binding protein
MADHLIAARGIWKAFPGVQALADVSMHLDAGEVLAVCGENGAGKSTLMKILAGVERPDAGEVMLDGRPVRFRDVADAQRQGVALIHQELNLAENLDVAANVYLGREPTFGGPLRLLSRRMYADAEPLLRRLGLDCSPRTRVADLTIGQQQLVEIARVLALQSRVVVMDEPTSSLTQRETERLFEIVADLKRQGIGILYISHRLKEIETIADRVTVLRDGRNAGDLARHDIRHDAMVRLMVGRELTQFFHRDLLDPGSSHPAVLQAEGLRWMPRQSPHGFSFTLRAGEIVGMAGLIGSGRTELAEALFGVRPILGGSLQLHGQPYRPRTPADAVAAGVFLVPEDRRLQGLVLQSSVRDNVCLASMDRVSRLRFVSSLRETAIAEEQRQRLNIRTPDVRQTVGLLSGGNQQKVVLGKWLCRSPRLLVLDEPTRGVDVGAKSEIYALMANLARQGIAILMISSDLEEILGMSNRVLVMHEGRLAGELARDALSEEAIMTLATGA